MNISANKRLSYISLVIPALLIYTSVIIFPIISSIAVGFTEWAGVGAPKLVGLAHYVRMWSDQVFRHGLRNNLLIVVVSIFGQIPFGFVLAYIIYRRMVKAGRFFETMIFLPITISPVVVAILWNQIFSPSGLFTQLMRILTEDQRFVLGIFEDRQLAIVPILFVILWFYTGIYMVIFIANLQKISPSVIEAAVIDGAREYQILGRVIVPSMVNIIFTTAVFAIAGSLKSFDLIFAMTGGGPANYTEVIAIHMYINTFKYYNYGYGSAVSVMIIILSLGLISLLRWIFGYFEKKYE